LPIQEHLHITILSIDPASSLPTLRDSIDDDRRIYEATTCLEGQCPSITYRENTHEACPKCSSSAKMQALDVDEEKKHLIVLRVKVDEVFGAEAIRVHQTCVAWV
jgi:hypothetical protein